MSGDVWASPRGDLLITRGGDVFTAAGATRASDMVYQRGLTPIWIDALAFDAARRVIVIARARTVSYYNLESLEWVADATASRDVRFLGVVGLDVYTLSSGAGSSFLERSDHLVPDGDTNTPPVAAFDVSPAAPHTTLTDLTLDASTSSDAESGLVASRSHFGSCGMVLVRHARCGER